MEAWSGLDTKMALLRLREDYDWDQNNDLRLSSLFLQPWFPLSGLQENVKSPLETGNKQKSPMSTAQTHFINFQQTDKASSHKQMHIVCHFQS